MHTTFNEITGPLLTAETTDLTRTWFWPTDSIALECVPEDHSTTVTQVVSKTDLIQIDINALGTLGAVYFYPNPTTSGQAPTRLYAHEAIAINGYWADFRWDTEDLETLLDYMPLEPTHIIKHPVGFSFMWRHEIALPRPYKALDEYWLRALATVPDRPFNIGTPDVLPLPGTGGAELAKADDNGYTYEEFMEAMDYPDVEIKLANEHMPY